MLKSKVTAEELAALPERLRDHYVDGQLQTDEAPELRHAIERTQAEIEATRAEIAELEKSRGEGYDHKATMAAIETDHLARMAELEAEHLAAMAAIEAKTKAARADTETLAAERAKLDGQIRWIMVRNAARELAGKLSTNPDLMLPHIESRLTADPDTGEVTIADNPGKSLAQFSAELMANAQFATIARANPQPNGKHLPTRKKAFHELSEIEQRDLLRNSPAEFHALMKKQ